MLKTRETSIKILLDLMSEFDPGGYHTEFYKEFLESKSDEELEAYVTRLENGEEHLTCFIPNFDKRIKISTDNNIELGEKLGYHFYQHLWITDPIDGTEALTFRKHLVYESNICRQTQLLDDKISVAKDSNSIDAMTGQVRGDSLASRLSGPEFMILNSQGLGKTIKEFNKFRGGDNISGRMLNQSIIQQGVGAQEAVPGANERQPQTVKTLSILLNGMLFGNNFAG